MQANQFEVYNMLQ